jgi:ABC-type lipoprotein export system ATPase subunit
MVFRLEKIIPLPMLEIPTMGSDIWEAESFIFESGQKYLVEAASGKGKTSLLSILYGLRKDYRGSFFIDNKKANELGLKDWALLRKEKISFIFQGLELFEDLTAMENILLKNRISNFKSQQEITSLAEKMDVAPFLKKKSGLLSYGQKQRVAIIRSLCQPFQYLFADECFSHIDKKNSSTAMDAITEECEKQGAGLILTSLGNNHHEFHHRIRI